MLTDFLKLGFVKILLCNSLIPEMCHNAWRLRKLYHIISYLMLSLKCSVKRPCSDFNIVVGLQVANHKQWRRVVLQRVFFYSLNKTDLVSSPRATTVIERGMWPTGTWSLCSWTLSSWHFKNFDPRVCKYSLPPDLIRKNKYES